MTQVLWQHQGYNSEPDRLDVCLHKAHILEEETDNITIKKIATHYGKCSEENKQGCKLEGEGGSLLQLE